MTAPKPVKPWLLGSLSPTKDGKNYIQPPLNFPSSNRVCNASSEGIYTGERWLTRPGSDHSALPSKGGC